MRSCMVTSYFSHWTHSLSDGLPTLWQWHIALLFIEGMWACVTLSGGKKCCMHFFKLKLDFMGWHHICYPFLTQFSILKICFVLLCANRQLRWAPLTFWGVGVRVSPEAPCAYPPCRTMPHVSPPSERAGNPSETWEAGSRAGVVVLTADSF